MAIDNAIYDRIPTTWWDEDGFMALLRTSVNPPRFAYFRQVLIERLEREPRGLHVLDVGCGGGLLAEAFAALGCTVTGVDRSLPTLAAARVHAETSGLSIRYLEGDAQQLPVDAAQFDVVCCCDVLEHVDDPKIVIGEIARALKPSGVFFFDTLNRTFRSKLVAIKLAQDWRLTRLIPRNVHVWNKFIRPHELTTMFRCYGLRQEEFVGLSSALSFSALSALVRHKLGRLSFAELGSALKLKASRNLSISYMGYAVR